MIVATSCNSDVILKISVSDYLLERKVGYNGTWEPWNGSSWGGVPVYLTVSDFTDYNLSEDIFQYRYQLNGGTEYVTSNCVVIGGDPIGWTFYNYEVPEGQFGEILTPEDLRLSFLWGVSFTATDGQPWTDNQTRKAVEWATYQVARRLNITIYPVQIFCDDEVAESIEETKDIKKEFPFGAKRSRNYLVKLRHRPIQEVTRFDWYSPVDSRIANLLPWKRLDRKKGYLWFMPKYGALQTYAGYGYPWNVLLSYQSYPDAFHIDYKAGYKTAEFIPEDLREIIGKVAALKLLNVIGDGLIAGFSSSSLSLDGMSESFSSTQSATSVGGNMYIRLKDEDIRMRKLYRNRKRYIDRPVLSINRKTNEMEYKPCTGVYRHNVSKKKCYRIHLIDSVGEKHFIDITEDHSVFLPNMKTVEGKDVKVGTWLRTGLSEEKRMKVIKVRRLFFRKYMFDLSVKDNENFVANNIVAHNSAFFGARILQYEKSVSEYLKENKWKYSNVPIGSI